jgi:signal peptidase II
MEGRGGGSAAAGWARTVGLALATAALDQASKAAVRYSVTRGERSDLALGLDLVHVQNTGIAFGLFAEHSTLLTALTLIALAVLIGYFARHAARRLLWVPTGLMLGGAAGNLIDRARLGAVTDFLDPPWWPAFNLADAAITIGVLALVAALDLAREHPA